MKVLLLKDIKKIGRRNDVREVSDGFARNFLIPQGLAVPATDSTLNKILHENEAKDRQVKAEESHLRELFASLKDQVIQIHVKANASGHLFAALHGERITQELEKQGILLPESVLKLERPIKEIGTHRVPISRGNISGELVLEIISQG